LTTWPDVSGLMWAVPPVVTCTSVCPPAQLIPRLGRRRPFANETSLPAHSSNAVKPDTVSAQAGRTHLGPATSSLTRGGEGAALLSSPREALSLAETSGNVGKMKVARPTAVETPMTISAARTQMIRGACALRSAGGRVSNRCGGLPRIWRGARDTRSTSD